MKYKKKACGNGVIYRVFAKLYFILNIYLFSIKSCAVSKVTK